MKINYQLINKTTFIKEISNFHATFLKTLHLLRKQQPLFTEFISHEIFNNTYHKQPK